MNNKKPVLVKKGLQTRKMYSSERMIFWRPGGSKAIHSAIKENAAEVIARIEIPCLFAVLKHGLSSCATLSNSKTPVIRINFNNSTVMQRVSAKWRQTLAALQRKSLGSTSSTTDKPIRASIPNSDITEASLVDAFTIGVS